MSACTLDGYRACGKLPGQLGEQRPYGLAAADGWAHGAPFPGCLDLAL